MPDPWPPVPSPCFSMKGALKGASADSRERVGVCRLEGYGARLSKPEPDTHLHVVRSCAGMQHSPATLQNSGQATTESNTRWTRGI